MVWNFVGTACELRELAQFLELQKTQIYFKTQNIQWKFIPEHASHFGGIWESAVNSMKTYLRRIVSNVKQSTFGSSAMLWWWGGSSDPWSFFIGRPLESLPEPAFSYHSISLLHHWHLCQSLIRHFWRRWYSEYVTILQWFTKWHHLSSVCRRRCHFHEDGLVPRKWPLARITEVHKGQDGLVWIATIKTANGTYKWPVTKLALCCLVRIEVYYCSLLICIIHIYWLNCIIFYYGFICSIA